MTAPSEAFTCAQCGETFPKGWSDEEAAAEHAALFGELPADDPTVVVCDDCFHTMTDAYPAATYVENVTGRDAVSLRAHEAAVETVRRYKPGADVYDFALAHRIVEAVLASLSSEIPTPPEAR